MTEGKTRLFQYFDRLSLWTNIISSWGLFVLMALGIISILLRLAGVGLSGVVNLTTYLMVAVVYLSLAYAQLREQHVRVDFFVSRIHGKPGLILTVLASLLALIACLITLWGSWKYAWASLVIRERMDGAPFYPIYPTKIILSVGLTVLCLQLVADVVKIFNQYRHKV